MKLEIESNCQGVSFETRRLLRQMHSPLCGLCQRLNYALRSLISIPVLTVGAELTGVHALFEQPVQRPGSYHIGASGPNFEGVLNRTLGETAERYAQIAVEPFGSHRIDFGSYQELSQRSSEEAIGIIAKEHLFLFDADADRKEGFPFVPFDPLCPMGWIQMESLIDERLVWIPTQLVLVGYRIRRKIGERKFWPAVTTGTAAHRDRLKALLNALIELIQIDAAVGHWYSDWPCVEVVFDSRTDALGKFIERYERKQLSLPRVQFIYIPSPDLPTFPIACIFRSPSGSIPVLAVGLGCSLSLVEAMYKAWLEALGVWDLASINSLELGTKQSKEVTLSDNPLIYDLDSNVGFYAQGRGTTQFERRFAPHSSVFASELPADFIGGLEAQLGCIIEAFSKTNKELLRLDLTTTDLDSIGLIVERVWSPDTLNLPLPSAPPTKHPRFKAFGGLTNEHPHPYP
jgi:thiazole/oxazole-forming peptide maturase SagD family component